MKKHDCQTQAKAVVRDNISSHYAGWHNALKAFSGSTADMLRYCVESVLSPLLFLVTWKHSQDTILVARSQFNPEEFLAMQIDTLLYGVCGLGAKPSATKISPYQSAPKKGKT